MKIKVNKMNISNNTEDKIKKLLLLIFGRIIRKTMLKKIGDAYDALYIYEELVASPIKEWRDRMWCIRKIRHPHDDSDFAYRFLTNPKSYRELLDNLATRAAHDPRSNAQEP